MTKSLSPLAMFKLYAPYLLPESVPGKPVYGYIPLNVEVKCGKAESILNRIFMKSDADAQSLVMIARRHIKLARLAK
jgi:hypothetical protein